MKSFVAHPYPFGKKLWQEFLYKGEESSLPATPTVSPKVGGLQGTIVKCAASPEGHTRVAMFRKLIQAQSNKKVIAFEKITTFDPFDNKNRNNSTLRKRAYTDIQDVVETLQKGINEKITFIAGNLIDSIPRYLIDNPQTKISFLNIDLNDYDTTITALQFLYPRLVNGGILVFDNYHKKRGSYSAIHDYFAFNNIVISDCFDNENRTDNRSN